MNETNTARFNELAGKVYLKIADEAEKLEFKALQASIKKEMRRAAIDPIADGIAKRERLIAKLQGEIAFMQENNQLPPKGTRGRKAATPVASEDAE